jgi:hypothetical protein
MGRLRSEVIGEWDGYNNYGEKVIMDADVGMCTKGHP